MAHLVVAQWGPGLWQPGQGGAEEGLCLKVPCFKGWRKATSVSSGAMGFYRVRNLQRVKENYGVLQGCGKDMQGLKKKPCCCIYMVSRVACEEQITTVV